MHSMVDDAAVSCSSSCSPKQSPHAYDLTAVPWPSDATHPSYRPDCTMQNVSTRSDSHTSWSPTPARTSNIAATTAATSSASSATKSSQRRTAAPMSASASAGLGTTGSLRTPCASGRPAPR